MIYTSELAAQALGLSPSGDPYKGSGCTCAMCQRLIIEGQLVSAMDLPKTFMDFAHLAPSDYMCGFCNATRQQSVMRELQRSVITEHGIYNLNTDASRAWFWLTPPKPPFSVAINHLTTAAFHYFWRTPVTTDIEVIQLNVDDVIYLVRRRRILQALEYAKLLVDRAKMLEKKKGVMVTPFKRLDRAPSRSPSMDNGCLTQDAVRLAALDADCKIAFDFLSGITPGERIALSPFLKQKPADPLQPEISTKESL